MRENGKMTNQMEQENKHMKEDGFMKVFILTYFKIGSFLNGNKHGQGKLTFPDGSKYTGSFENDLISGFGTLNCSDGRMYVGEWKNGNKHGKGVFTWADGRKYDGYYVHDERDGYGVL